MTRSQELLAQDGRYQAAHRQTAEARVGNGARTPLARRPRSLGFWVAVVAGAACGVSVALGAVLCS